MDQIKTGALIKQLRINSGLTQKQLADSLCVSDKAVSKWECGNGCPDVSLLSELADIFGTDVQTLLSGEINKNESEKGNMKKLRFYVCHNCGNIVTATSEAAVTCCGNKLTAEGRGSGYTEGRGHRRRAFRLFRPRNEKGALYLICGLYKRQLSNDIQAVSRVEYAVQTAAFPLRQTCLVLHKARAVLSGAQTQINL